MNYSRKFRDRRDAGSQLASRLESRFGHRDDVIVLGLPRGGVPVAKEVAEHLGVPLDVLVVRKVGVPWHPELAMGAVASGGIRVVNRDVVASMRVGREEIDVATREQEREVARREERYRGTRPRPKLLHKTVILVDDGLATGASMRAAVEAVRTRRPRSIVVAVPAGPPETCASLADEADEVICVIQPVEFFAVGQSYLQFPEVTDDEVGRLLEEAWATGPGTTQASA